MIREQYWGVIVCSMFGDEAADFTSHARALASDETVPVRIRAAELLSVLGTEDPHADPLRPVSAE